MREHTAAAGMQTAKLAHVPALHCASEHGVGIVTGGNPDTDSLTSMAWLEDEAAHLERSLLRDFHRLAQVRLELQVTCMPPSLARLTQCRRLTPATS